MLRHRLVLALALVALLASWCFGPSLAARGQNENSKDLSEMLRPLRPQGSVSVEDPLQQTYADVEDLDTLLGVGAYVEQELPPEYQGREYDFNPPLGIGRQGRKLSQRSTRTGGRAIRRGKRKITRGLGR